MPYVLFGPNNYSVAYLTNPPVIGVEDWYELPEGIDQNVNYKLVDGIVQVCTEEEIRSAFYSDNPYLKDHFNEVVSSCIKQFLNDTDWLIQRHSEQVAAGLTTSLTDDEYAYIIGYRQYLRELTNQTLNKETFTFQEFTMNNKYNYLSYNTLIEFLNEE